MKKYMIGLLSGLMLAGSLALSAPAAATAPSNTAPPSTATPRQKMLWDYQSELGLSNKQVTELKQAVISFEKVMGKDRTKLQTVETNLQGLIQKNGAPETIRTKVHESANIQADMRIADIMTARKINATLTSEQLKKWEDIQQKLRAEQKQKS